jgi:uncharacterized protein
MTTPAAAAPAPPVAAHDALAALTIPQLDAPAMAALAAELGVGELLLKDVLYALGRPGRDPREDLPPPVFRRGILKLDDLAPGMQVSGTVLNVVDFGAFVDIGLADSALVHISRLADRFISDPHDVVGVGDVLRLWVLGVDRERRRVSLTALDPSQSRPAPRQARARTKPPAATPRPARPASAQPPRPAPARAQNNRPARTTQKKQPARPNRPAKPITKAMEEGREPMRTFGDLLQFYEKKRPPSKPSS